MKDHSIKEAAEHFNVCTQRIYKYKKNRLKKREYVYPLGSLALYLKPL